ncbi:CbtA family protein [Aliiroseovarius sp. KMU-50]|uniref:CbtA family protein n=1 Tax=Aliiroseovarius salicola TaxID=3009082 RepID=A0ABT4W4J1_9RHOB|nr:CbtA family protein [Aliiroseovarius sp. KMU-50]MDA5095426.1 CbtA family protein [Aliiroseovarius sp. KMU-50]
MIKNLASSAMLAGVLTGIIASALQFYFVIPLVLEGELYETGARIHFPVDGSPQSEAGAPGLGGEWGRHLMTVAFNFVSFTAYGLILVALMAYAALRGVAVTPKSGLLWGLAGFTAVQLAPAMGLPPELPGTIAPEVMPRQIWWSGTIIASAAGLALIAFGRGLPMILGGAALLLLPHLIGAPHLDTYWGVSAPELAAHFATVSLGVAAASWAVLGTLCAWFYQKVE